MVNYHQIIFISHIGRETNIGDVVGEDGEKFQLLGEENYDFCEKKLEKEELYHYKIIWLKKLKPNLDPACIKQYTPLRGLSTSVAFHKNKKNKELFQKYKAFREFCTKFVNEFHYKLIEYEININKAVVVEPDPIKARIALSVVGEEDSKKYYFKKKHKDSTIKTIFSGFKN